MPPKRVTLRTRRPSNPPAPEPQASSSETQATTIQPEIPGSPENSSRDDLSDDEVADTNVAALSVALEGSVPSASDTQTAIAPPPHVSPLASSMRIPGSLTTTTQTSLFQHMFRLQPTASGSRKGKERATQASSGRSSSPVEGRDETAIAHILANTTNVPPPAHTPSSPPPHSREHISASAAQTAGRRDKRTRPAEGDLDLSGGAPSFSRAELVSMLSNLQSSILEQCRQLVLPDAPGTFPRSVLQAGRNAAPPRTSDEITTSLPPAKRRRHYPVDQLALAAYARVDPNTVILPRKIIACLEGGMQKYIPLSLLTSQACRDASRTAAMDKEAKQSLSLEDGDLRMAPAAFDATGEDQISLQDWIDASARFVKALSRHLLAGSDTYIGGPDAQKLAREWEEHFRIIRDRHNFTQRFVWYRAYDIAVRRVWHGQLSSQERHDLELTQVGHIIRPDEWHEELFKQIIEDEFYQRIYTNLLPSVPPAVLGSSSSASATRSYSAATSSNSSSRYSRHQAETERQRKTSASVERPVRCMYCGKRDHRFKRCPGTPGLPIQRDAKNRWADKDGNTYCIAFNGPIPCSHKDACQYLHSCSLCLSRDHGAQLCLVL